MTAMREIVLYGASGHANAVRCAIEGQGFARVAAFIDDFQGDQGHAIDGRPVISFETWRGRHADKSCLIAVADTAAKRRLVERISAAGGTFCMLYDQPQRAPVEVAIGQGSLIAQPAYVGPQTRIGDHVLVMPMTSVGHDVEIGAYGTICPSSSIGGHVVLEEGVFVGAGSTIVNGKAVRPLIIGAGATIGAGAVVTKAVAPGATVMGNPARPLRELARAGGASGDLGT
jgi:sugar O-acyltransferase (sialic acid O-acetyltransferase NeuD family)